jgi:hypothetical protein
MEKARAIAQLGPAAVSEFMAKQGYPKHDAWCGDFAAATVRAAGGTPPKGWSTASNWRNVGPEVAAENAQPGDIAVRRPEFHGRLGTGRTGDTGSHVTILDQMLKDRRFSGIGGNQGRIVSNFDVNKYQFYRPHVDPDKATAGRKLDGSLGNEVKSRGEATGKLSADVTAPPGTKVEVNGKGVFSKTETTRRTPINSEAPAVSI